MEKDEITILDEGMEHNPEYPSVFCCILMMAMWNSGWF